MHHSFTRSPRSIRSTLLAIVAVGAGCRANDPPPEKATSSHAAVTTDDVASLALANVGGTACGTNTLGGSAFESSCTGNGGQPEYWCADFAMWVWQNSGADVTGLSAAAGSFFVYGQNNGTLSNSPAVGDAVVFDYEGGGYADHVAIVTAVYGDGTIETVSGDWNGQSGSEAYFSSTSSVVLNTPSYDPTVGSTPGTMGMTISGYIAPVGVAPGSGGGAPPPAGSAPCAGLDDGYYCGNDGVPGDPGTLYQCAGGALAGSQPCPNGCQDNPGAENDACVPASSPPPPPPPSGGSTACAGLDDGFYCGGDDVPGDPNTLYQCSGGALVGSQQCPGSCIVEPGTIDDQCQ